MSAERLKEEISLERQFAYFAIDGKGSIDHVSEIIGLFPTGGWSEGDKLHSKPTATRRFMRWKYESGLSDESPLDVHVNAIISRIEPFSYRLALLPETFDAKIVCVGHSLRGHALYIDRSTLKKIASLGLAMDFGFYNYE